MQRSTIRAIRQRLAETALAAGALTITIATIQGNITEAIAGVGIMMLGATRCVMRLVDRAVRDTSSERERLERALEQANAEHARYLVARAFVDREAAELCRTLEEHDQAAAALIAAETERVNAQFAREREELMAELEDQRAAIQLKGFRLGHDAGVRGIVFDALTPAAEARVIRLPLAPIGSDTPAAGRHRP